jgi:quercetin dioxygenase-like cupin family protein
LKENNDPLVAAKNVYKLVMENQKVRVLDVNFRVGDKALMHHHPDHVIYVLKGGKMRIKTEKQADTLDLTEGQAVFLEAQNHEAENIGKTDVHLLVVELK